METTFPQPTTPRQATFGRHPRRRLGLRARAHPRRGLSGVRFRPSADFWRRFSGSYRQPAARLARAPHQPHPAVRRPARRGRAGPGGDAVGAGRLGPDGHRAADRLHDRRPAGRLLHGGRGRRASPGHRSRSAGAVAARRLAGATAARRLRGIPERTDAPGADRPDRGRHGASSPVNGLVVRGYLRNPTHDVSLRLAAGRRAHRGCVRLPGRTSWSRSLCSSAAAGPIIRSA